MFLVRFPSHELSEVRIGTVTSRHKDCSVLQSLQYIKKIFTMTFPQLSLWLWSRSLCTEFKSVFKTGEEINKRDSYMPYLMELQLSAKSPYSTVVNPNIHFFLCMLLAARFLTPDPSTRGWLGNTTQA